MLAGLAAAPRWQAGWRVSEKTAAKATPGGREPLSAITAGCVSLAAMLIPGPVITSGQPDARQAAQPAARSLRPGRVPPRAGRHRADDGGCAALAATRAPGHEPHDDEDGHRDQPDDDKRLERGHDPARSRDGKPYSEDRAEDCPDNPAHVPSMPPGPVGDEPNAIIALPFPAAVLRSVVVHGTIAAR